MGGLTIRAWLTFFLCSIKSVYNVFSFHIFFSFLYLDCVHLNCWYIVYWTVYIYHQSYFPYPTLTFIITFLFFFLSLRLKLNHIAGTIQPILSLFLFINNDQASCHFPLDTYQRFFFDRIVCLVCLSLSHIFVFYRISPEQESNYVKNTYLLTINDG